jgi:hypothetical protein
LTGYYNLMGFEGVGTNGSDLQPFGPTPPLGDYATTHCRYIKVPDMNPGDYYLRYPLHLPDGAIITTVKLYVADFNVNGILLAFLRSRPWNSRGEGTLISGTFTDDDSESDKTISMVGLDTVINNRTTSYWIDVTPTNRAEPGQLCVYGIQVTYIMRAVSCR